MWRAEVNIAKLVEGVPLVGACERDWCDPPDTPSGGRGTRNFLVEKYPCFDKGILEKEFCGNKLGFIRPTPFARYFLFPLGVFGRIIFRRLF